VGVRTVAKSWAGPLGLRWPLPGAALVRDRRGPLAPGDPGDARADAHRDQTTGITTTTTAGGERLALPSAGQRHESPISSARAIGLLVGISFYGREVAAGGARSSTQMTRR